MTPFRPDWVSPPGDTISDLLDERDWTVEWLAQRMKVSLDELNGLLAGTCPLSREHAARLSAVLGGDEVFWLAREAQYREFIDDLPKVDAATRVEIFSG